MTVSSPIIGFDQQCKYVTSYLFTPLTLALIRLVLGSYALVSNIVILAWSSAVLDDVDGYFSYFTHLSYVGLIAWFWASGVQTLFFARTSKESRPLRYPLQSWHRVLQFLHELLFATIATYPVIVTIVYWALLSSSESFSTPFVAWENISQHILNLPFVLFEIVFTNAPHLRWIHLPITVALLGLYLGVAYITRASQGFYVYDFLNPQMQGALLAGYIFGIGVGQAIVFIVIRYVIVLRERLVKGRGESDATSEQMHSPMHEKEEQDVDYNLKA
ncbi:hypothetical protein Agabi119p4_10670 [Agaricus bisporus var. burnettii]|uniref:FAR-17a/AIG1-like protein n=1 Tax=Agaricus bisporus var. burnettii TaxID=192524 RepID=A0A8H7EWN4_AGABI|nr:hypothetical protein Agabi119p4_10670 [Agaricus bisporus var. burnettii]